MSTAAAAQRKIVSISSKRQITIPQKFFNKLGFSNEAECILRDNEIIIKPVTAYVNSELSEHILADLIEQGLTGNELLEAFKKEQAKVRPAVKSMLHEARMVAEGKTPYSSIGDIFDEE